MPGTLKTEAIVLRSIRYGEADRVLHLYTKQRGRVGAIAKGSRRPRSRFGGRLEPFFRLELLLYEGRGELMTVTSATTLAGHPRLRESAASLTVAARACDSVLRLLDSAEPNDAAYNLLSRYLALLDANGSSARGPRPICKPASRKGDGLAPASDRATALSFRLKLALAAGFVPELSACAQCGEPEGLVAFSGAAGGVVCGACEAGGFPISSQAHEFMVEALGRSLAEVPAATEGALNQVERAVTETVEHHAHVRLRAAA